MEKTSGAEGQEQVLSLIESYADEWCAWLQTVPQQLLEELRGLWSAMIHAHEKVEGHRHDLAHEMKEYWLQQNESACANADSGFLSILDATSLFGFSTEYLNTLCMSPWFWPLHTAASPDQPASPTAPAKANFIQRTRSSLIAPDQWSVPLRECIQTVGLHKKGQEMSAECERVMSKLERVCEIHSSTNEQMTSDREKAKESGTLTATRQVQQNFVTDLLEENLTGRAWAAIAGQLEKVKSLLFCTDPPDLI